jgi:pilus assembly protein Flp/PilA
MMKVLCTRAADCESGATAMEYAVTAAILSVALLTGAETLGTAIQTQFGLVSNTLAMSSSQPGAAAGGTSLVSMQTPSQGQARALWSAAFLWACNERRPRIAITSLIPRARPGAFRVRSLLLLLEAPAS